MKIENEILSNFELNCEIELIQGLWHLDHEQYSIGVTYLICKGKKLGFENKILELLVENKRYEEVLLMMNSIDIEIETIDDVLCIQKCYLHCGLYYESFCFSRNCLVNHEKIHRLNLQESKAKSTIFNPLFNFFISNKKVNLLFQLPFNQDEENLLEQYLETLKNKNTGYNFLFVWYLQKQKISQAFQINDKLNNIEKINGKINLTRNNLINIHHNWFPSTKDNSSIFLKNSFDLSTTSNSQSITDNKIISETSLLSTTKFMSKIKSKNKQSLKKSKFETPMFQTGNENEKKNKNEIEIESERNRTNFFVSNFSNLKNPNISTNHNFQSQPPTSQNTKNIPEINIQSYRKSFGTSFTKLFSNTNFDNDDDQNSTTRKKLNFQKYKKITQTPNKQEQQEQTSSFFSNLDNSFENKLNTDLEIEIEKEKENENESETESESESENNEFFLNQNSGSESESDLEQQSFDLQNSEQTSMSLQKKKLNKFHLDPKSPYYKMKLTTPINTKLFKN
ncbi:e3 ubiquitin-protein ligase hos1 [Anaeramoeba flamelloides]|uniref:E3 ubiquitin-protein ligase hos1 n=1 Tax=Anaeramoeba flamelloides TaxID=1746091 RepID=A0AAV8AEQ6_9EUKA|nr:e3 ubiquitin-protein ligase hos1 [Anaeramoeba flamelloides]